MIMYECDYGYYLQLMLMCISCKNSHYNYPVYFSGGVYYPPLLAYKIKNGKELKMTQIYTNSKNLLVILFRKV